MFWLIVLAAAVHAMDISWHKPSATDINNLDEVLHGDGVFGFIFNSSDTPRRQYGVYNYCNMPHVRMTEYKRAPRDYELVYVEAVIIEPDPQLMASVIDVLMWVLSDPSPSQKDTIPEQYLPRGELPMELRRHPAILPWSNGFSLSAQSEHILEIR